MPGPGSLVPGVTSFAVVAGQLVLTVGWVLEEQAPAPDGPAPDPDALRARFPVVVQAISDYFVGTGRTPQDLYKDAARQVLGIPKDT